MADFQQRDNSGALFKNDRKESDKHPDYTGNGMVYGKPVRLAAWIKDGKRGKFMSLKFSEPQSRGDDPADDPSIPF